MDVRTPQHRNLSGLHEAAAARVRRASTAPRHRETKIRSDGLPEIRIQRVARIPLRCAWAGCGVAFEIRPGELRAKQRKGIRRFYCAPACQHAELKRLWRELNDATPLLPVVEARR